MRFFRSQKYELIYLNEFTNLRELKQGINQNMAFYYYDDPICLWIGKHSLYTVSLNYSIKQHNLERSH